MANATATTNGKIAEASLNDIVAQIAALRSDIDGLTASVATYGKAQGRALGAKAQETAEDLRDRARANADELARRAADAGSDVYQRANDFVTRQPGTAIGLAAGIGFVVGLLTQRRG